VSHSPDPLFGGLRSQALSFVDPSAPEGDLYGVFMEIGMSNGIATLVALGDGTISLYLSNGGGFLGVGEKDGPAKSAHRFATTAMRFVEGMPICRDASCARDGEIKFFVLIDGAVRCATESTQVLRQGGHPLSPLFRAGHALLTEVRRVHPDGWALG